MKYTRRFTAALVALFLLSFGLSVANAALGDGGLERQDWRTAPRHSAGLAPDPAQLAGVAIV